jgi:hypothetical protein
MIRMGYKEKIHLLEDNLSKLDNELKSVKTSAQSTIDSTLMLTQNFDQEMNDLSNKITEFEKKTDEAIKEKDKEKAEKALKEVPLLQSELRNFKQKAKPVILMAKKAFSQSLEEYRLQSAIIRQISVPTSDHLDNKILELEKLFRKYIELEDQWIMGSAKAEDIKSISDEASSLNKSISQTVTIARDCIKFTIEKFKD